MPIRKIAQATGGCAIKTTRLRHWILGEDRGLARRFLIRLFAAETGCWTTPKPLTPVLKMLSDVDRLELIDLLNRDRHGEDLIRDLVADSVEAFRVLLGRHELEWRRFAQLRVEFPSALWRQFVACALDAGIPTADVIKSVSVLPRTWWGPHSALWETRVDELRQMKVDAPRARSAIRKASVHVSMTPAGVARKARARS